MERFRRHRIFLFLLIHGFVFSAFAGKKDRFFPECEIYTRAPKYRADKILRSAVMGENGEICISGDCTRAYEQIRISKKVIKNASKLPLDITENFLDWAALVERTGIREVRKIPGYHDEPLRNRPDRSVRLNKAYRVFYETGRENGLDFILVVDINNHKY